MISKMLLATLTTLTIAAVLMQSCSGRTILADSSNQTHDIELALDADSTTFWTTETEVQYPHDVILDLEDNTLLNGLRYLPRQDGPMLGNIGGFVIETSIDDLTWEHVADGVWDDDQSQKSTSFPDVLARYVRVTALTEAGGRGSLAAAAEFDVLFANLDPSQGVWGPIIDFPLVPAAAFLVPTTAKVLIFSSSIWNDYTYPSNGLGYNGSTLTATWCPITGALLESNVTNTQHDMFCPGLSLSADGCAVVTGGDDSRKTSILCPEETSWKVGAQLNIPRGYQASATLSDGRIFTIGGSWSGPQTLYKNGEIFDPMLDTWTYMPGCSVASMLTHDHAGMFRQDNHGWLFGWKDGSVFQAGPSLAMNWYGTAGDGSQVSAGLRALDSDSMNGNAVLYDAVNGRILTVGGSPDYANNYASNAAHLVTIGDPYSLPTVEVLSPMLYQRAFANAVVLPDGKVFVVGGQAYAVPFTDAFASLHAEIWDPATRNFTVVAPHSIPRTYHSVALLLPDATVFSAGGGLCGDCGTNHPNGQVYRPGYLFTQNGQTARRPRILRVSSQLVKVGQNLTVHTDVPINAFSLIRYGSATHTVNTDQRRIALNPVGRIITAESCTQVTMVPSDPGIAIPGYWMLFAMTIDGVPSEATTIKILAT